MADDPLFDGQGMGLGGSEDGTDVLSGVPSEPVFEGIGGGAVAAASLAGMGDDLTAQNINLLNDVEVSATVELGRTVMAIRDVLKLRRGSVVELEKLVGQPVDLLINNTPLARGEVIVINERFGFRITKFITPPS